MSSHQFVFPPPPPPPPPPPQSAQSYQAFDPTSTTQNGYGYRRNGGQGSRGFLKRGNSRGSRSQYRNASGSPGYSRNNQAYNFSTSYFNGSSDAWEAGNNPSSRYPPVPQPQYPADIRKVHDHIRFEHSERGQKNDQLRNGQLQFSLYGHDTRHEGLNSSNGPQITHHHGNRQPYGQPVMVGSPVRSGYGAHHGGSKSQFFQSSQYHEATCNPLRRDGSHPSHAQNKFSNERFGPSNSFFGRQRQSQSASYRQAYGRDHNRGPKSEIAPAVPSFGTPLPTIVVPPEPQGQSKVAKQRGRKHNQLGLTPKTEEHESSEEEDDADEETHRGAAGAGSQLQSQQLQFSYKGRTSNLQSASDISSWVEERKQKFPTKARTAEAAQKKIEEEEGQKAAKQVRKEAPEEKRAEAKKWRKERVEEQRSKKRPKGEADDVSAKAKRKVEELRKQLEKEEKRIVKVESRAKRLNAVNERNEEAPPRSDGVTGSNNKRKRSHYEEGSTVAESMHEKYEPIVCLESTLPTPKTDEIDLSTHQTERGISQQKQGEPRLTSASNGTVISQKLSDIVAQTREVPETPQPRRSTDKNPSPIDSNISLSETTSDLSSTDSDDFTSSSGSSSSPADDASEDEAPEESTTKRTELEMKPAHKRGKPKQVCRVFLRSGRCRFGAKCRNLHESPQGARRPVKARDKDPGKREGRKTRIGLYQRLVEQEKEKEHQEARAANTEREECGM